MLLRGLGLNLIIIATLSLLGCSSARDDLPEVHPVTGRVTLDGAPLDQASVQFIPTGSTQGNGAAGATDAEGKYSLETPRVGPGAPAGTYKVAISKVVGADGKPYIFDPNSGMVETGLEKDLVPKKYSDASQTQLTAEVEADGPTSKDFELTSK